MAQKQATTHPLPAMPVPGREGHTSIITLLGFKKVSDHIDDLRLYFLIGCAYHDGAKSLRRVAKMLRAPRNGLLAEDLAGRVGKNLPLSLRAISQAVAVLEDLLGKQLLHRTAEGFSYDRLNKAGERFWGLTAEFVREFWV